MANADSLNKQKMCRATMKLSIIIPAYNEIGTIDDILKLIKSVTLAVTLEIVIVDDGSTDGTREYLSKLDDPEINVFFHERNCGKGTAIRTALEKVTGDIILIQDADLEYDPNDYVALIKPIIAGESEVVYGNRRGFGNMEKSYERYYWGGRLLSLLTNLLYSTRIHDEPVCYKVFTKNVLEHISLKCTRFEFCPEVTAKIAKAGYKIYEVPISYKPRKITQGKKINWKDGVHAIWTLLKYRFVD